MAKRIIALFLMVLGAPIGVFAYYTNQPASVVVGQQDLNHNSSNQGGTPEANTLYYPQAVVAANDKIIVVDNHNARVLIYNSIPATNNLSASFVLGQANMQNTIEALGADGLYSPTGVFCINNTLFVNDFGNQRVLIYGSVPASNHVTANIVIGQVDMNHAVSGVNSRNFNSPHRVCSDGTKLIIADEHNHRVLVYNQLPTADNATADVVIGQQDLNSNGINQGNGVSSPAANTLYYPIGVFIFGGKLFIADASNARVLIYNQIPTANNASANIEIGEINMNSNVNNQGGPAAANTLCWPHDVFYDGARLFIVDTGNNRILIFNQIPTADNVSADQVIGQPDMNSNNVNQGGSPAANTLHHPYSCYATNSKLFVADQLNNRVLIYDDISPTITPTPTSTKTPTLTMTVTHTPGNLLLQDQVYAAPNPIRGNVGKVYFYLSQPAEVSLQLFTVLHDEVLSFKKQLRSGRTMEPIHVANLANGVYLMLVNIKGQDGSHRRLIDKVVILK